MSFKFSVDKGDAGDYLTIGCSMRIHKAELQHDALMILDLCMERMKHQMAKEIKYQADLLAPTSTVYKFDNLHTDLWSTSSAPKFVKVDPIEEPIKEINSSIDQLEL